MVSQITSLSGYPICPKCGVVLRIRSMPGVGEQYWHCEKCLTEWDTTVLIEHLNKMLEHYKSLSDEMLFGAMRMQADSLSRASSVISSLVSNGDVCNLSEQLDKIKQGTLFMENMSKEFVERSNS